jgi:hypothetical protein
MSRQIKNKYFNLNPAPTHVRMQIDANMSSLTLPTSDIDLDLLTLPVPEAGDFVEFLLLYPLLLVKTLFCKAEITVMMTVGLFDVTVSVDVGEIVQICAHNYRSKTYQISFEYCRNCLLCNRNCEYYRFFQWRTWNFSVGVGGLARNFFRGDSTNSVKNRGHRERGSGGGSPLVSGSTQLANE